MKVTSIFGSKLSAAEASFKSAFGVLEQIQDTAEIAADVAGDEEEKAVLKRVEYENLAHEMRKKKDFYLHRAQKISQFILSLDD